MSHHITAAKGPEPPGPLITGTQMGRGGDLPGEHARHMAKVESRDVPLEKLGKTTEPHRKFFRPCCSYLFMASCIFQLFDKIGFLRFFQRKRLKKWNCEGSQVLSDSPRLCRFRPFANEKLKSWGKKTSQKILHSYNIHISMWKKLIQDPCGPDAQTTSNRKNRK